VTASFFLYDTASRKKVPFVPREPGRARLYTCGPTVYRHVHIGNLRTYLLTDLLVRSLRFLGCSTHAVQNITDMGHMHEEQLDRVEDKVIAAARAAGKSAREIAEFFTETYFRDCGRMNFLPSDAYPRASAHVGEMIAMAQDLERAKAAYRGGGYLYFDVEAAAGYGGLSGAVPGKGEAAARTDAAIHRHKKRPEDFTLWLPAEPGREYSWESPWGLGWPGWHIECAAMALTCLGPEFDVHVGGADLRFPHHENTRVVAMTATGGAFASIWLHAAHLLVEGHKMAKSRKNEYTLDDLESRGVTPMEFRYHCLTVHYRTPMNFTWEGQEASAKALDRLRTAFSSREEEAGAEAKDALPEAEDFRRRFHEAISDDLNAPRAVSVVHEAARSGLPPGELRALAEEWDDVLGVGLLAAARDLPTAAAAAPPNVVDLAQRREALRRERRYAEADLLRDRIREAGYDVVDRRDGRTGLRKR
jgi:cysteinyl-tRNA synthetase